jgi:hypothetical protein
MYKFRNLQCSYSDDCQLSTAKLEQHFVGCLQQLQIQNFCETPLDFSLIYIYIYKIYIEKTGINSIFIIGYGL